MKKSIGKFESTLGAISKQSAIVFIGKILSQGFGFLSSILMARILGATLLGRYYLGLILVQIASYIALMGFDRGLVRFIPVYSMDDEGKTKRLLQSNIAIVLFLSICLSFLLFNTSSIISTRLFHSYEMSEVLKIFSFYIPIFSLFSLGLAVLRGFKRVDISSNVNNIIMPLTFLIFLSVIILVDGKLNHVITVRMISTFIAIIVVAYFMLNKFSIVLKAKSSYVDTKNYLFYCLPFLIISILYFIIGKITTLMLGYFVTSDYVGVYSVIVYITALSLFGLQAVNAIFAPYISELYTKGDLVNIERLLKILTRWSFNFALFVFVLILIFRIELLKIYGNQFAIGARAMVILAAGQIINAFSGSTGAILLMTGRQNWEVINSIIVLFLNVTLNIILIPKYGIEGAAIAAGLSIGIINIMKVLEVYKELRIHPYNYTYFKGLIGILIGATIVYFVRQLLILLNVNFFIILVLGSFLFLLMTSFVLYCLKIDIEEKQILDKFVNKIRGGFKTAEVQK